jgi:peptidoglycan/xylan/chitin deacetylase (PgdA/CDA1 family)
LVGVKKKFVLTMSATSTSSASESGDAATVVFLAGDWHHPPTTTADELERRGFVFTADWWNHKKTYRMNKELLTRQIDACDVYLIDQRSPNFGKHPFAGSILGAGMAMHAGKTVINLLPEDAEKPYTSLLAPYSTKSFEEVLLRLENARRVKDPE